MTGAFLFSGGFWLIVIWFLVSFPLALVIGRACGLNSRDDEDPGADEREAYARIYSLRSFDERVENVVPTRTDKWL